MKRLKLLCIICLAILLLSGCDSEVVQSDQPAIGIIDQQDMPVLTQDSGPAKGGRLSLFMTRPQTLNPLFTDNPYIRQMSQFVFDSLFIEDGDKVAVPFLVESFKTYDDPLIIDIKLRDSVIFHNGTSMTASDVAFTINTIMRVKGRSPYYANISNISSVKAVDRLSLRIILLSPDKNLNNKLTFPILSEAVYQDWPVEGIDATQKLIGSGAFYFDSYDGIKLALSRNDAWWYSHSPTGLDHPVWMDGVDFKIFEKEGEMIEAFQKQQIDVAVLYDGNLNSYGKRTDILFNLFEGNRLEYILLSNIGSENNRLANPELRKILLKYLGWYMALNPIGTGAPATEEMLEYGSAGNRISDEEAIEKLTALGMVYDANKNQLYYYKAGAKIPFSLRLKYNGLDSDRLRTGEWIQEAFTYLGIEVTLEKASQQDERNLVASKKFDLMLLGCRIPLSSDIHETMTLVSQSLGYNPDDAVLLPLYQKSQAVLYNNKIRGPRKPNWKNIYYGWKDWYIVEPPVEP